MNWEGPIGRSYLETIYSLGFTPERIIHLVPSIDIQTKKPLLRWGPNILRQAYSASLQKYKINYWPNYIIKNSYALYSSISDEIHTHLKFSTATLSRAYKLMPLDYYCKNVDTILIKNLSDPTLREILTKLQKHSFLYTGGGILPQNLLSIPQHRFIHIHPGYLPDIRGADCTLWSSIIAGCTSATCFYMAPGIDTGDIILARCLPKIKFKIDIRPFDLKTIYRALYGFFDPWMRSYLLRHIILKYKKFDTIPTTVQNEHEGVTYHFMHAMIQKHAFKNLFISS